MIDILSYPFMQRAIAAAILIGFLGSYYGVFIVQRRMSFMGSGLAHSAFGGIALGLLLESEPLWIALPFTVMVAIIITWIQSRTNLSSDTSIGILFSFSVALGIIFISIKEKYSADAFNYLFGSILSVTQADLSAALIFSLISVLTMKKYWNRWAYATFDIELAFADRLKVERDNYVLSALIAVAIVISIKLVGIILITAFVVIPAATAKLLSKTFYIMTILSIALGIFSALVGLLISFYIDLPSGSVIIIFQTIVFIAALFFNMLFQK